MLKLFSLSMLVGALLAGGISPVHAQDVSEAVDAAPLASTMTLRDAIYFYNRPINSKAATLLVGENCDVFEIVLDVESGYTDLHMDEWSGGDDSSSLAYPNRIYSEAAMFAYTLYTSHKNKSFTLGNNHHAGAEERIGAATFFGYCFSTSENAKVFLYDESANTCHYSKKDVKQNCSRPN